MKLPGNTTLAVIGTSGMVPDQLGRQESVDRKGVFTGMVFCPQRHAGIAIMRCAEYQKALGCGRGCPNAATPGLISLVTESVKLSEESHKECLGCGRTLLVLNRRGLCRTCAPAGNYFSNCTSCGGPKGYTIARRCRDCAMKARKEKNRHG